ncbi:hypothetical protein GETHLI_26160 [Geothrix limicola]|uniref:DNA primase/polymerase bifunctional N-terminal domain-containing protein n=2 Tax=Geothrix limicola TaxID=2927978 RepID=A0ABQ5QJA7_9BACT|nr:bifunctional DNA primase/polymerase [Geothrix limicola]GLH74114.1 hypothetical protein GETHLI_26160 [Geothrix limicola]
MPKSPLWILDADSHEQVERVVSELFDHGITPLMVATPSGGAHFYGMLPDDFPLAGLKNHLPDGAVPMDFKFGPKTLVVCPGSRRKGIEYRPMTTWTMPPVMDPRWFKAWGFWHKRDDRPFLTNPRPLRDRLVAARQYLQLRAPLSVSGKYGHLALARVCSNLVAYHRIEPRTALTMLAPWNARCTDTTGKPCPWSRSELLSALDAAKDAIPESGVKAYQRAEAARELRERIAIHVRLIKVALTIDGGSKVPVSRIRRLLGWFGLNLTETALGNALRLSGCPKIQFTKKRIRAISGMNYSRLVDGLLAARRDAGGRDLNKHEPALPKMCPLLIQVEQVVSGRGAA